MSPSVQKGGHCLLRDTKEMGSGEKKGPIERQARMESLSAEQCGVFTSCGHTPGRELLSNEMSFPEASSVWAAASPSSLLSS